MESIKKIDDDNLEITDTRETKRILPKVDIERNIRKLEDELVYFKGLLDHFK